MIEEALIEDTWLEEFHSQQGSIASNFLSIISPKIIHYSWCYLIGNDYFLGITPSHKSRLSLTFTLVTGHMRQSRNKKKKTTILIIHEQPWE